MFLILNFVVFFLGDVCIECKNLLKEFVFKWEIKWKRLVRLMFYDVKGGEGGLGINIKVFEYVEMLVW